MLPGNPHAIGAPDLFVGVKGHAGQRENERCDQLAVAQSKAHGGRQGT